MSNKYRTPIRYSNNFGPLGFDNPDPNGPLLRVSFCIVDSMIHIFLSHNPFGEDLSAKRTLSKKINQAIEGNPAPVEIWSPPRYIGEGESKLYIPLWELPTHLCDLEGMVQIMEQVPELKAGWLREAFEALKYEAGLTRADQPEFNSYRNGKAIKPWFSPEEKETAKPAWLSWAWMSANGGTIYFNTDVPVPALKQAQEALEAAGAEVTKLEPVAPNKYEAAMPRLRFIWSQPMKDMKATSTKMQEMMSAIPGLIEPLAHGRSRSSDAMAQGR